MHHRTQSRPRAGSSPIWLAAVLGAVLSFVASGAYAGVPQGDSQWKGQYGYNDARAPVPFSWSLSIAGDKLKGKSSEPATFGDGSVSTLTGNLAGTIAGTHVSIIKTYDGSGGVGHSVRYSGDVSADGREITGNWQIDQSTGPFSVDLVGANQ
ncbi:MAG TPA: hypothetical protein VF449_08000 [Parvibaculum sp.]